MSTAWADRVEFGLGHDGSGAIEAWRGGCSVRRGGEQLVANDPFDYKHELRAERALDLSCGRGLWRRGGDVEQQAAAQQRSGPLAVGEEAEVADADQAFRQNVDEEAPQELVGRDHHDLLLADGCVVLPAEGDLIVLEADEAMVRDRDTVGVAGEIVENVFGTTEGRLGVDDPVLGKELSEEMLEAFGCSEFLERAVELELALEQKLLEFGGELAAEDAAQDPDRQEEA